MPKFTLETQRGKKLTIESDSPENAMRLADQWDLEDHAASEATKAGVNPDLILRQMQRESGGNPNATSPKGAHGPMQLMPGTAKELGVDPSDPYQNISGGVKYMRQQLDAFGGDESKALAAYNAGPGAVRKYGGVPPYAETQSYVRALAGQGDPAATQAPAAPALRPVVASAAPAALPIRKDQGLGFAKGLGHTNERIAAGLEFLASKVGLDKPINDLGEALGLPTRQGADQQHADFLAAQAAKGVIPGKIGEFGGNVAGTVAMPGGILTQGALGSMATGNATDAKGLMKEAAGGALTSRLAVAGGDALQLGARKLLSKAPNVLTIDGLKKGYQAAYKAIDDSGFAFPKAQVSGLVDDLEKAVGSRALSRSAKEDAADIIGYARNQLAKGDVSLSQMDKFRQDIYAAMVKKGGDTGALGQEFRTKIDGLIDSAQSPAIKSARELYKRWTTADFVNRASKSADRAAEQTYGGDYGRKVKDRLAPLVDELKPTKNIRGASDDVKAGIEQIVRGTKAQNLASTVGGMLDPRRMGGKILSSMSSVGGGAAALPTGGASLLIPAAQMGTGFALTGAASHIARKNVDDLIKLIAAGGSKSALAAKPTQMSYAMEKAIAALRPALAASAVPAVAAARTDPKSKKTR